MNRIPEPELMIDPVQALAYAQADFDEPHSRFIALLRAHHRGAAAAGVALDLGCGPGDITFRFARAYPGWEVDGIDASPAMLALARAAARQAGLATRVAFAEAHLPSWALPHARYDLVISNSLLHHLADAGALWAWLASAFPAGTPVFLMDLMRPASRAAAQALVDRYAAGEPDVLRQDFFNSLLAAYTAEEVRQQVRDASLDKLEVAAVSDRHLVVSGPL
ncbi:MAG: trans-aconitate 2-methyltransferase [Candidatus Binatia bacterium]